MDREHRDNSSGRVVAVADCWLLQRPRDVQSAEWAFLVNLTPQRNLPLARDTGAERAQSMPREAAIFAHRSLAYSALAC